MNEGMPGAAAGDADIHSQGSTGSGGGVPDLLQSPSTQAMPLGSHSPLVNTVGNQAMGETLEQSPSAVEQPQLASTVLEQAHLIQKINLRDSEASMIFIRIHRRWS